VIISRPSFGPLKSGCDRGRGSRRRAGCVGGWARRGSKAGEERHSSWGRLGGGGRGRWSEAGEARRARRWEERHGGEGAAGRGRGRWRRGGAECDAASSYIGGRRHRSGTDPSPRGTRCPGGRRHATCHVGKVGANDVGAAVRYLSANNDGAEPRVCFLKCNNP
jgi:hypothetical protein